MEKNDSPSFQLPTSINFQLSNTIIREKKEKNIAFKIYVIVSMTLLWTAYTLTVRYTRSIIEIDYLYSPTTVVFLAEITKWTISMFIFFRENHCDTLQTYVVMKKEFLNKPKEFLRMSVPSICYAVQNNLDFIALSNLDAAVYQVTTQLKVITTALFMVLLLGRRYSIRRWFAILLLFAGVATVQIDALNYESSKNATSIVLLKQNYFIGLVAVLCTCLTAGFAGKMTKSIFMCFSAIFFPSIFGVYFEKMLKESGSTPFWIRNLQMYTCGIIITGLGCFVRDETRIRERGFFFGYNSRVFCIVGLLGAGGIYISLVMKHLDNLHKSFASAFTIILVVIASVFFFEAAHPGLMFVFGTTIVCSAILLYNTVPE